MSCRTRSSSNDNDNDIDTDMEDNDEANLYPHVCCTIYLLPQSTYLANPNFNDRRASLAVQRRRKKICS